VDMIVAVFADREAAESAADELLAEGLGTADIDLATGGEVLEYDVGRLPDQAPLGRFAESVSRFLSDDAHRSEEFVEAARSGAHFLVVHESRPDAMDISLRVLDPVSARVRCLAAAAAPPSSS
jgi:hypothetical protein